MKIAFVWQDGVKDLSRFLHWKDGLWAAMKLIEKEHEVKYFEPEWTDQIREFSPDFVLYWEAPCTLQGKNAPNYRGVMDLPFKKGLLFAGGPVNKGQIVGFDIYFLESACNEPEFEALGVKWTHAFGVNTDIFKPMDMPKVFDGMMHATFAGWKRQPVLTKALKERALLVGRYQETDPSPYIHSEGAIRFPETSYEGIAAFINMSHTVVNTSSLWGGGQRCTLEAMACGVPVIAMSDSPKNREFVEGCGVGRVVDPDPEQIRTTVSELKVSIRDLDKRALIDYVNSGWSHQIYANQILDGIKSVL